MERFVFATKEQMGAAAAEKAAAQIRTAVLNNARANIILATGASQFETLSHLVAAGNIDWSRVTMFHLDEYIGLNEDHPASFRRYLRERFVELVPRLAAVHFVNGGAADPEAECDRLGRLISENPIDAALVGIGENGHLAFNDPPADFETEAPYIVVDLDEQCRRQQLGEGWFATFDDVPSRAISMSIRQIMKSRCIIVSVPDRRKAQAVAGALEGPVTNICPSSILQRHRNCFVYMDEPAASQLSR